MCWDYCSYGPALTLEGRLENCAQVERILTVTTTLPGDRNGFSWPRRNALHKHPSIQSRNTVSGQAPVPKDSASFLEPGQSFPSGATSLRRLMMEMVTATTILTSLDRLNLSIAGKYIQDEFSIPLKTMGWIFSAFLLGYAL